MRLHRLLLFVGLFPLFVSSPSIATVRDVPGSYATIQAALNASTAGDQVLVAPGVYHENLVFGTQQSGVALESSGGPAFTTIDGGVSGLSVVRFSKATGPGTRIEGFTLANSAGNLGTLGGGISAGNSNLDVVGNIIRGNPAGVAGGIYFTHCTGSIVGNQILGNHAPAGSGGGIYIDQVSTVTIRGNVIAENTCGGYGGGVTIWEGSAVQLAENTIAGNTAAVAGGGLYVTRSSSVTCTNDIVAFNSLGGGVVIDATAGPMSFRCCDAFGNSPVNYSGISNPPLSSGNILADPIFCDRSLGNYDLSGVSPCAPANSPGGCGRIGALPATCFVTPTIQTTWGRIKTRYR